MATGLSLSWGGNKACWLWLCSCWVVEVLWRRGEGSASGFQRWLDNKVADGLGVE
jgi:hypothetical protein